jgi:hypothetical protein
MNRYVRMLGGLVLAAALTACGGGGGSAGTTTGGTTDTGTGTTTVAPLAATIDVFTSSAELSTASNSSVSFTVVVKDSTNRTLPGKTVTFSASSGNLSGSLPTPSTGTNGEAITTVSLSPGSDRSNRNITVTLKSDGITKDVVVPVTGSTLSLSGDSFVLVNGTTTFTIKAVDTGGKAIGNSVLTVASSLGNGVSPVSVTTNSQGVATFNYTGTRSGNDVLTVTGLGTSASAAVAISSDEFRFETPASGALVPVNTSQLVTVRFLRNGVPVSGQSVTLSTTRGSISPTAATTDANGRVSANVTSSSAGPGTVVAQTSSSQVTLPIMFVAINPSTLVLQANPGAVPPNAGGTISNQSTLLATVRDAAGNPVAGRVVNFTAITDGSAGSIAPGSSLTDSSGTATTLFIPGAASTANNGVVIQATVQGTAVSGTAALTVNTQALFISIATGNDISNLNQTTYEKQFSVYVTDANGTPAANRVVNLAAIPDYYYKGFLVFDTVKNQWQVSGNGATQCPNEDVDRDGVLDSGEDINFNGKLEPGLPVVVTPASVTTDATGFATFSLRYGENFVPWLNVIITARTNVGGTESVKTQDYALAGAAPDFTSASVSPAGVVSPFGFATACEDPR